MRNLLVGGFIALVVVVMIWAGVHNLKTRRAQEAAARNQPMTITVDKAGATATTEDGTPVDLRGKQATNFKLKTVDGKEVTLASLKGKAVLLNFWATWCAPCKIEMPWFEEFNKKYAAQGLEIVGVDEDDDVKSAQIQKAIVQTVKNTGVTYPIVIGDANTNKAYGDPDVLPATYFIDRSGKIVAQAIGLAPKSEAEANVQKILATQ